MTTTPTETKTYCVRISTLVPVHGMVMIDAESPEAAQAQAELTSAGQYLWDSPEYYCAIIGEGADFWVEDVQG